MNIVLQFTEEQHEVLKVIAEQVAAMPEALGVDKDKADEIYDIVFERK